MDKEEKYTISELCIISIQVTLSNAIFYGLATEKIIVDPLLNNCVSSCYLYSVIHIDAVIC
ncbi:MAG: hypothetical protein A4E59_02728 [Syntrophorhabdus sp. PtaB.Bin027]|nr:MAG: hypothetical protein A4E59_02728 [Syntrophorhabdus sp. PtaB.Bin027]OQB75703.1 MAG: hypothetical protein BWX92_02475 [Deltaproteobacteria bacterium ADurb.Bin135]